MGILTTSLPHITAELAQRSYEQLLDPARGFFRQAKLDAKGLETVLELRSRYGEPRRSLAEPAKYHDPAYYEAALGTRLSESRRRQGGGPTSAPDAVDGSSTGT